jgi:hypothetical protein
MKIEVNTDLEFNIPKGLCVRWILQQAGKTHRYIENNIDKYHDFLNTLFTLSTLDKRYKQNDFKPLCNILLRNKYGKRYWDDIKNIFGSERGAGVIETDFVPTVDGRKNILKGRQSIGYRLTAMYQGKHVKVLQDSETTFIRKLRREKAGITYKMDDVTRQSYFHLNDLGIYNEAAKQFVEVWYQQNLHTPHTVLLEKLVKFNKKSRMTANRLKKAGKMVSVKIQTYEEMLDETKEAYIYQIKAVDEKLWPPVRDNKGRRIHSYIAVMWRELRQFLYYIPNPCLQLVSLDCSNSQPYTLVKIIFDYYKETNNIPDDVRLYIKLVTNGELYRLLWVEMGKKLDDAGFCSFKVDLFALVFYSKNNKGFDTNEAKTFRAYFPNVYEIIMQEKRYKYEQLAIEMQRVETKAVIDGALSHLFDFYGNKVPFYSIHDAIICPVAYAGEVREVMLHFYTETVGIAPHIKPAENFNNVIKVETLMVHGELSTFPIMKVLPADKPKKKYYKHLSGEQMWELQEAEEWGDETATRLLKLVVTESELDFTEDDMPFFHYTYKIEKKYWKYVS